ncbi:hypothetical protein HDU82_001682, partial [Entophlyctis luteolus]
VFQNFAHWHNEYLNDPAAGVSIVHVHAYYLTDPSYGLPHWVARDGSALILNTAHKGRIGGIPKQFGAFMTMFHLYRILLPARQPKWTLVNYVDRFRFVNLRLSLVKSANDTAASKPNVKESTIIFHNASPFFKTSYKAIKRHMPDFNTVRFTNGSEIFDYVDPAMVPIEYGGTMTDEQIKNDVEDFIRRQYEVEGLRYTPIDIKSVNWKTYRVPGMDFVIRPESAISVKTVDYDAIDAELEALGIKGDGD